MSDIQKGYTYTTGSPGNQVTADNLNQLVDSAVVQPALVTAKTEKTTPDPDDLLLIADSANGDAFKKLRVSNLPQGGSTTIVNQSGNGLTDFKNLSIVNHSASPNTTLDITIDEITLGKTNGAPIFLQNVTTSVNITAAVGAGGLDAGAEANNTWYYIYLISDGTNTSALFSLSATAPTMPGAYVYFGLIGCVKNDFNGDLWAIQQFDNTVTHLPIGLANNDSAVTLLTLIAPGGTYNTLCPIAKQVTGFVFTYANISLVLSIASGSLGLGETNFGIPALSASSAFDVGTEGPITSGNNALAWTACSFTLTIQTPGEFYARSKAGATHWGICANSYTI